MSDETNDKDVPEFVAVTPRASREEPPAEPATEPDVAPEPDSVPDDADAESEVAVAEPAADEAEAADEPQAEPVAAEEPSAAAEPETAQLEPESSTETKAAEPESGEPATPAATLQWTPPAFDRPVPPPGPEAKLPEPEPTAEGDEEVSVRVAAEGMAAALAGAPTPPLETDDERTRSVGPLAILTAICVVLALAAGALLAVTAHSNSHHRAVAAARVAALDAAKRETAIVLTYDYRTLDADFQRAEAGMSRKFRANYAQTAASSVAPLAAKTHAITTGSVAAAGVVSAAPDTARILVYANQTVENKLLNATSRLDRSVIEVTMVKENGRWVIDNLQPF